MRHASLTVRGRTWTWGQRTYVMGILNITPDSFSGDGLLHARQSDAIPLALAQAERFILAGVDVLDIGAESTRPGAQPVGAQQELDRIIPIIHALRTQFDIPISVDTYRAPTAEAALQAGADMINDVWGLHADPDLAAIAARYESPLILMHNRSSWANAELKERLGGRYVGIPYENLVSDIRRELLESVYLAHAAGVRDQDIILDPGVGFGKSTEQNLELVDRLEEFRDLGYPVLLGASRKSFIGYTLNLPPDQRVEGTAAAVAIGICRGADIVRVHDVEFMVRVARMTDAIVRRG